MALFRNYQLLHDGIDTGVTINGKTLDNYRPEQVARFIGGLPEVVKQMVVSRLRERILPEDTGYEWDEKRRHYHYQPDFKGLKESLKRVEEIPLYLHRLPNGTFKKTPTEKRIAASRGTIEHSVPCPACKQKGIVALEYCGVCWGQKWVTKKSKVVVIPCDLKTYNEMKRKNPRKLPESNKELKAGYPEWTPIDKIKRGTALSWDDLEDMC